MRRVFVFLAAGIHSDRVKLFCIAGGHFLLCRIAFLIFAVHHLLENHSAKSKPMFLRRFAPKPTVFGSLVVFGGSKIR